MLDNGRDACKENVVRAGGKRETVEKVVRGLRVRVAGRKHLRLVLRTPFFLKIHDLLDLHQKPAVDLCQFENQPDGEAGSPCAAFIFWRFYRCGTTMIASSSPKAGCGTGRIEP
jgi:hypothetical protein